MRFFDFLLHGFLHESPSPKPLKITLGWFWIFRKFAEIFASQGAPRGTAPVANNGNKTISGCRHLKMSLKANILNYVNSTTQRCPNKIIKIFLIEDFFHLPSVSTIPVVRLELRISSRIFEKIRNGPNGLLRGLGETESWKNQKSKISWHSPFTQLWLWLWYVL
jgi:hypothetical protein